MPGKTTQKKAPAKKTPPVEVRLVNEDGTWVWVALDKSGKEVKRGDAGRSKSFARKQAFEAYPDLPLS